MFKSKTHLPDAIYAFIKNDPSDFRIRFQMLDSFDFQRASETERERLSQ